MEVGGCCSSSLELFGDVSEVECNFFSGTRSLPRGRLVKGGKARALKRLVEGVVPRAAEHQRDRRSPSAFHEWCSGWLGFAGNEQWRHRTRRCHERPGRADGRTNRGGGRQTAAEQPTALRRDVIPVGGQRMHNASRVAPLRSVATHYIHTCNHPAGRPKE